MKKTITTLALVACNLWGIAQNPTLTWAKQLGGTGIDYGSSITVDASGNVYTVGRYTGVMDLDPSASVFTVAATNSNTDIFISKVDASGNFVYGKSIGSTGADAAFGVTVNAAGNIYVTGSFGATVDFDPGAGVSNLTAGGSYEAFVLALDPSGNFLWAGNFGGSGSDEAFGIDVDASNNIYITGYFNGTADFDPSASLANLTSAGSGDGFVVKLNSAGVYQWSYRFGGTQDDVSNSIAVSSTGLAYIAGKFMGTIPAGGFGSLAVTAFGQTDGFVLGLDASGAYVSGALLGSAEDEAINAIALDETNDALYMTGHFSGNITPLNYVNQGAAGTYDLFLQQVKLNTTTKAINSYGWGFGIGTAGNQEGMAVDVDNDGNVFVSGYITNTFIDFDPSPSGFTNLSSVGGQDGIIASYTKSGAMRFAFSIGNANFDNMYSIKEKNSNVYTTGIFQGTEDFDPSSGTTNLTSVASGSTFDSYALKFNACNPPAAPTAVGPTVAFTCQGTTKTLTVTVPAGGTANWYAAASGGSSLGTGLTFTSPILNSVTSYYAETMTCGASATRTQFDVNMSSVPNTIANSNISSVCIGGQVTFTGSNADTYSWSGGVTDGTPFTPTVTSTYTVTGTSSAGCIKTATISIPVYALPIISIVATNTNLCAGQSVTITATGANSYNWDPGIGNGIGFAASISGTYSVIGIDANNCGNTASIYLNVNPTTTLTVSASNTVICIGSSITLNGGGATSYTWTGGVTNGVAFSPSVTTTYTLTGAPSCGSSNQTITINVNALPNVTATSDNALLCTGQSANLTANGATSYTWNNNSTTAVIAVTPTTNTTYTVTGTNVNGCSNVTTITQNVSSCTGINSINNQQPLFVVYPNPSNGVFNFDLESDTRIIVLNALGAEVLNEVMPSGKNTIYLNAYANGIYFMKAIKDGKQTNFKLIKN